VTAYDAEADIDAARARTATTIRFGVPEYA
jgi:hypothetical protein